MAEKKKITEQTEKALLKQLAELTESLRKIRFDRAAGRHGELDKMQKARKMIARIKTELRRRQLTATSA